MQDQALIKRALELHEMGKSIRQIAGELKTSKSTVFRWLNGQSGNGGNALPIDLFAIATNTQQSINQKINTIWKTTTNSTNLSVKSL